MKKLICALLTVALMLSMCIIVTFAEEETNVALNKPVSGENFGEGEIEITLGFWKIEYLTDGLCPAFPSENQDRLGWYSGAANRDVDMVITIDLEDLYDISRVYLYPQKFLDGQNFPSTYTLELSADGENWTKIGEESELEGVRTEPMAYGCSVTARYIKFRMTKLSPIQDPPYYYAGLGEIEAYGVKHVESAHEPVTRDFDSALDKQYFDQVLVNGTEVANGNDALIELKKNPIDGSDGSINTISTYGWYASIQDGITLDQFGYMIDDNEPVFSADFTTATGQDVLDLGGTRYLVNIDVTGLNDGQEHVLTTVCRLSNGDIVKFNRPNREAVLRYVAPGAAETQPVTTEPETQVPTEPETNTQTGDFTVAMFAVIAVLAMGAAVVFAKKRAF